MSPRAPRYGFAEWHGQNRPLGPITRVANDLADAILRWPDHVCRILVEETTPGTWTIVAPSRTAAVIDRWRTLCTLTPRCRALAHHHTCPGRPRAGTR